MGKTRLHSLKNRSVSAHELKVVFTTIREDSVRPNGSKDVWLPLDKRLCIRRGIGSFVPVDCLSEI
jgi:hypothetical protein